MTGCIYRFDRDLNWIDKLGYVPLWPKPWGELTFQMIALIKRVRQTKCPYRPTVSFRFRRTTPPREGMARSIQDGSMTDHVGRSEASRPATRRGMLAKALRGVG
jgi:hypothetical protein